MNFGPKRRKLLIIAAGLSCLLSGEFTHAQTSPAQKPLTAGDFFKNIKVLNDLPVNEFMTTMGFFSASLGYSCENCHGADTGWANYAADNQEKKQTARRMILMMTAINKTYFGGKQVLTCYTCHRGGDQPTITPNLAALYSPPPEEPKDLVQQAKGAPSVDEVISKYLAALGGRNQVADLASFIATGTVIGYGVDAEKQPVEIYAKTPDRRSTIIHSPTGDNITTLNGNSGWLAGAQIAGPDIPVPVLALSGGDLEGLKLETSLSFPNSLRQAFSQWRVGFQTDIDDRPVQVVQGSNPGGAFATFYFEAESGLLVRVMRYTDSFVGRFPTEIDYSDYRQISGVKVPFKWTVVWLDGKQTFELSDIKLNAPIGDAKFAKPDVRPRPTPNP